MIRLKQIVTLVLVSCFTISASGLAQAQTPAPPAAPAAPATAASNDTMAAGLIDGEALGEGPGTGAKLGVGLAVGVLTGLIGTGIGYCGTVFVALLTHGSTPTDLGVQMGLNANAIYQVVFRARHCLRGQLRASGFLD